MSTADDRKLALSGVFQALDTLSEVPLERDLSPRILAWLAAESRPWQAPRWLRIALLAQILAAGALLATQLSAGQALLASASGALSEAAGEELAEISVRPNPSPR